MMWYWGLSNFHTHAHPHKYEPYLWLAAQLCKHTVTGCWLKCRANQTARCSERRDEWTNESAAGCGDRRKHGESPSDTMKKRQIGQKLNSSPTLPLSPPISLWLSEMLSQWGATASNESERNVGTTEEATERRLERGKSVSFQIYSLVGEIWLCSSSTPKTRPEEEQEDRFTWWEQLWLFWSTMLDTNCSLAIALSKSFLMATTSAYQHQHFTSHAFLHTRPSCEISQIMFPNAKDSQCALLGLPAHILPWYYDDGGSQYPTGA